MVNDAAVMYGMKREYCRNLQIIEIGMYGLLLPGENKYCRRGRRLLKFTLGVKVYEIIK